jgi:hypothetical protein
MKSIEVVLVPILMLADYYLTVLGNFYRRKKYSEYYVIETYELNPLWKKDIDSLKIFNYKHILIVILFTAYFLSLSENANLYQFMIGNIFALYGFINGRHLNNIFLFRFIYSHSDEVAGKVQMSHFLGLKMAQYQLAIVVLPFLLLTILQPNNYLYGGLFGFLVIFIGIQYWIRKHKKEILKSLLDVE